MAVKQRSASHTRLPGNDQDKVTSTWSGRTLKFNQQTSAEMRTRGLYSSMWCVRVCRFKTCWLFYTLLLVYSFIFIIFSQPFALICFYLNSLNHLEPFFKSKCPKWQRNQSVCIYFHFLCWSPPAFSSIQMGLPQDPNIFLSIICSLCRNTESMGRHGRFKHLAWRLWELKIHATSQHLSGAQRKAEAQMLHRLVLWESSLWPLHWAAQSVNED